MLRNVLTKKSAKVLFALGATGFIAIAAAQAGLTAIGGPCVKGIYCPAVYDPVTCPNGKTYSNACEAYRSACQTNCVKSGAI